MRTAGAAVEPGRNACAAQRMFEQAEVTLRRPDEDCHLIEANAAPRLFQNASSNLDALTAFAGCGKQFK